MVKPRTSRSAGSLTAKTPLVLPGQRVGIMGGTFNPPHDGHKLVAETAVKRLRLDQLWWLVTPGNPLKANGSLPSEKARMALCRQFARGRKMKVTSFEAALGSPYTAATVAFLKRRHPDVHFVWVMGADNLASFDRWQKWRDIAREVPIAVIDRPGWRHAALASEAAHWLSDSRLSEEDAAALPASAPPSWVFISGPLSDLSSTALRAKARPPLPRTLRK